MINYKELEDIGHKTGFTHIVPLDCKTIELLPEVRQMCQADTCHMYEKNWSCPPGCGSLEPDAVRNARPAPIRMLPAVFRENHFLPWKPTACLSLRFAKEIT